jgi:hypothetical protein
MAGSAFESLSASDARPTPAPESASLASALSSTDHTQTFGSARSAEPAAISSRESATFSSGSLDFGSKPDIYATQSPSESLSPAAGGGQARSIEASANVGAIARGGQPPSTEISENVGALAGGGQQRPTEISENVGALAGGGQQRPTEMSEHGGALAGGGQQRPTEMSEHGGALAGGGQQPPTEMSEHVGPPPGSTDKVEPSADRIKASDLPPERAQAIDSSALAGDKGLPPGAEGKGAGVIDADGFLDFSKQPDIYASPKPIGLSATDGHSQAQRPPASGALEGGTAGGGTQGGGMQGGGMQGNPAGSEVAAANSRSVNNERANSERFAPPPVAGGGGNSDVVNWDELDKMLVQHNAEKAQSDLSQLPSGKGQTEAAILKPQVTDAGRESTSDSVIAMRVPQLELPSPEQIMTLPIDQLRGYVRDNKDKIVNCIEQNYSSLPESLAAHGGTKESNETWRASGGKDVQPDGNANDRGTWVVGIPHKSQDASEYAAGLARMVSEASNYADPKQWINKPYTPGGVILLDVSADVNDQFSDWKKGESTNGAPLLTTDVFGLGTDSSARAIQLTQPEECCATGDKGTINVSQINQLEPLIRELGATQSSDPDVIARYYVASSISKQNMAIQALKLILKDDESNN